MIGIKLSTGFLDFMNMDNFYCLTGIDGTGKTTTAKGIVQKLNSSNYRSAYVWLNNKPILLSPFKFLWQVFFLKKIDKTNNYETYRQKKVLIAKKSKFLNFIYKLIFFTDFSLNAFPKLLINKLSKKIIIADRYFFDALINFSVLQGEPPNIFIKRVLFWSKFLPMPKKIWLIDIPLDVAMSRKNDIPSMLYLEERIDYYKALKKILNIEIMDGLNKPETLVTIVVDGITKDFIGKTNF